MGVDELIHERKAPTSRRKHVGIEIECLMHRDSRAKLEDLIIKRNLQWNVNVGEDGSIDDPDFIPQYGYRPTYWNIERREQYITNLDKKKIGVELRILAEEKEAPEIISDVCAALKEVGATANNTCGLHVHLDMRSRDYEKVYKNLFYFQDLMFKMQPAHRRNNERYCKPLPRPFKSNDIRRYYAINRVSYDTHRTIEVRLHEGTVNATEIKMWTYFLIQVANMETLLTKNVEDLNTLGLPFQVKDYLDARIKKYNAKNY